MARTRATRFPKTLETDYGRMIKRRVDLLHRFVIGEISAEVRRSPPVEGIVRGDALADSLALLDMVEKAWDSQNAVDEGEVGMFGVSLDRYATRQAALAMGTGPKPGLLRAIPGDSRTLAPWVRENVSLIKSVDARHFADMERILADAYAEGWGIPRIQKALEQRAGVSKNRSELIARDQMGGLYAATTTQRFTELGVREAYWRTSEDGAVRDEHIALNGTRFAIAKGVPGEGLPGQPIACRCTMEPIL